MSGAYSQDPSVMRKSILPLTNNAYDIGSATKAIRSLYAQTSIVFTSTGFDLLANTSDNSDNAYLKLSSGGAASITRGAFLSLYGNEHASTGAASLTTGDKSGAYLELRAAASNGYISLVQQGNEIWRFNSSGQLTNDATNGSNLILNKGNIQCLNGKTLDTDVTTFGSIGVYSNNPNGAFMMQHSVNDSNAPVFYSLKTRATDTSANTILADGDPLFNLSAFGADGTSFQGAASIIMRVDGTPGVGDMPSHIDFSVRAAGAGSSSSALVIKPSRWLHVKNTSGAPGSNPVGGGYLYCEAGALKYRGTSGTITTIANA